jgi:transposase
MREDDSVFNGTQAAINLIGQIGTLEQTIPLSRDTAESWFDFAQMLRIYVDRRTTEAWGLLSLDQKKQFISAREDKLRQDARDAGVLRNDPA